MAENVDGIIGPKRHAVRKIPNKGDVQSQIAQVIWRLDFQFLALVVKQPAKRTDGEDGETSD
jgi:hypothetical protein